MSGIPRPAEPLAPPDAEPTPAGAGEPSRPAGLASLAQGGLLSLAGSAVSAVAGVLLVLAVTRTLPQDTAGIFFALTSVFLIAQVVARLGTGTGLVYAVSRARALDAPARAHALLQVALAPVVAVSTVLAVVMFAGADRLVELVGAAPDGDAALAVRILAVLLPLTTVSDTLLAATRGHGTVVPTVALERVGRPLVQLAVVLLVATTGSLAALTTAWAAPWLVSALLGGWWLLRLQGRRGPAGADRPWREFWSFTAPRALTSVVQLALQRLDIVLLTVLAGPVEAAIYTAATRFLVVGQVANQGLAAVVEPRLAGLLALGDRRSAGEVYRTATGWLVLLCWPLYLLAATYADGFLDWFGAGYDAGTAVVVLLALTMLLATGVGMVDVVLVMGGRSTWALGNSVVALTVNVVVDLLLIPPLGIVGAAVGWAAAIAVNNLLPLAQVWRHMRLHPFGRGSLTAMVLAGGCFGALPLLTRLVWDAGALATVTTTAVAGLLFAAGCWRLRRALALDLLRDLRRERRRRPVPSGPGT